MKTLKHNDIRPLSKEERESFICEYVEGLPSDIDKVLILPPDYTRKHSRAGELTSYLYKCLGDREVDIMPALGTHKPMSTDKIKDMFGTKIPLERFIEHDWRNDTEEIGVIPADFVSQITCGKVDDNISVKINKRLLDGQYNLIISIGQVLPHEVVGMANYNKNIFVGCGGRELINYSHYIGAVINMEKIMGRELTPPRQLYNYAEEHFLSKIPLVYFLTVNSTDIDKHTGLTKIIGLIQGETREILTEAVKLSQDVNIIKFKKPLDKIIVNLDEAEFHSTWLGNKAVYRTRLAIADEGELVIIAPGIKKFGEDQEIDILIRKYGYVGTEKVLRLVKENSDLKANLSAAAHLIHGSSEGRFKITYACRHLYEDEIKKVNYNYIPFEEAVEKYKTEELKTGFNNVDGEIVYYIDNPATGLWSTADRF